MAVLMHHLYVYSSPTAGGFTVVLLKRKYNASLNYTRRFSLFFSWLRRNIIKSTIVLYSLVMEYVRIFHLKLPCPHLIPVIVSLPFSYFRPSFVHLVNDLLRISHNVLISTMKCYEKLDQSTYIFPLIHILLAQLPTFGLLEMRPKATRKLQLLSKKCIIQIMLIIFIIFFPLMTLVKVEN